MCTGWWGSGGRRVLLALVAAGTFLGACAQTTGDARQAESRGVGARTRVAATATSTTSTTPTTSTTEVPTTTLPVTPIQWSGCGTLQCGTVAVPLDYAHIDRGTLQIAVARHPASDPASRIGSLVINPGGPGGSGVNDLPNELGVLTAGLLDRFDIVSFDPRGVDRSSPVECSSGGTASSAPGPLPDPVPTTPAAQQALISNDRAYAAQCEHLSGTLLPFVGTVDTARDLDRIRQALGDPQLTFLGHSYGTLLGATYAQMFPTHVRAMVLDGAIDPALSTDQMVIDQSQGFEAVLNDFFAWCASSGCAWQPVGDATTALVALINRSRQQPIPAGNKTAGPGEIYDALLSGLYARSDWSSLARALASASAGNGAPVVAMSNGYLTGGGSNAVDAETAIDCLDHPIGHDPSTVPTLAFEAAVRAPVFGPLLAWGFAGCAVWPVPATRIPAPSTAPGAPPILVVGATGDPATPYVWAQHLAAELQDGVLLTWQGENHVAYYYSSCVRAADEAYLINGTPPAPATVCTD